MIALLLAWAAVTTEPLRCGAVERPGIAERGDDGVWRGVAVDLCRQAAKGGGGAIAFRPYRTVGDLQDSRHDALAVLSGPERAIAFPVALAPATRPIAISRQVLLVRASALFMRPGELAARRVCFIVASEAEAALNHWARQTGTAIQRVGFQEPIELRDGFDSGYCAAIAVDGADIPGGSERSRELGPALSEEPLFAITARRH